MFRKMLEWKEAGFVTEWGNFALITEPSNREDREFHGIYFLAISERIKSERIVEQLYS